MLQLELYSSGNEDQQAVVIGPINTVHVVWGNQIHLLFPNYEIPKGYPESAFDNLGDVKALYISTSVEEEFNGAVFYNGDWYSDFAITQYNQTASIKGEL